MRMTASLLGVLTRFKVFWKLPPSPSPFRYGSFNHERICIRGVEIDLVRWKRSTIAETVDLCGQLIVVNRYEWSFRGEPLPISRKVTIPNSRQQHCPAPRRYARERHDSFVSCY